MAATDSPDRAGTKRGRATGVKKQTGKQRQAAESENGNGGDRRKRAMSDDHKEALAQGREQGRAVKAYLEAFESHKPKRGRKVTKEALEERLANVINEIPAASGMEKLDLIQQRHDLTQRIDAFEDTTSITELEEAFVKVAKDYADRRGISRQAFREYGIPADVLKRAGV